MFGLGEKKNDQEFEFDLEKELKDLKKKRHLQDKIHERIEKIKTILRKGGDKKEFEQLGVLLQGYNSLLKVIERIK